jgi:anti-sigma B factor antagonist
MFEGCPGIVKVGVEMTRRFVGDVTVLDLAGRLVVSSSETEIVPLRAAVTDLMAEGRVKIALGLRRLTSIDARGLGELVLILQRLRRSGGRLVLVAPTPCVRKLLSVTRLDTVFELCSSEPEGIASLLSEHLGRMANAMAHSVRAQEIGCSGQRALRAGGDS